MIKLFVTGDNHFGKKYERFPDVKDKLIESRFECLDGMVKAAEEEGCGIFAITGDLFDNINNIKVSDVKRVVEILAAFAGTVLIIPGNHDYYTGDEKVWKDFENALAKVDHNIILLTEFKAYPIEIGDEKAVIYPAFCQSKHSSENNLNWIAQSQPNADAINIGIAHGAIAGITPDSENQYFLMTEQELNAIPVDAWLIGHTHIPYPRELSDKEYSFGYKIFNAGTHEQLDLHNDTEGYGFIITIDKQGALAKVGAKKYLSGKIHYLDIDINVSPSTEDALKNALESALTNAGSNTVVRAKISGRIKPSEYLEKENIYKDILSKYLTYEKSDNDLSEEITIEKIRDEYAQTSFAAEFMEQFIDNPAQLQIVYELMKKCRED